MKFGMGDDTSDITQQATIQKNHPSGEEGEAPGTWVKYHSRVVCSWFF